MRCFMKPLAVAFLVVLASCAGPSLDFPSASCRTNPAYCPNALLTDDAVEAGLAVTPPPPPVPPVPAPPPVAVAVPAATGLSEAASAAAAGGVALVLNDARSIDDVPLQDASPSRPSRGAPVRASGHAQSREGSGSPPEDPSCIHIGTSGRGAFRRGMEVIHLRLRAGGDGRARGGNAGQHQRFMRLS